MPPLEQLNEEQMAILLDFADRCRHLCFGRPPTGEDADIIAYKEWKELSRDLNYASNTMPWKSGKEWKMYWTELKNRTKSKLAHARRRAKFSGTPMKVKLNHWEQRIIELAEIATKEPRGDQGYDTSIDTTASIPDEGNCVPKFESTPNTRQSMEGVQALPIDMSQCAQPKTEQVLFVSTGTQMPRKSPVKTAGIDTTASIPDEGNCVPKFESTPNTRQSMEGVQALPIDMSQCAQPKTEQVLFVSTGTQMPRKSPVKTAAAKKTMSLQPREREARDTSQLSEALHALARANMSIADAIRALCSRVTNREQQQQQQ